MLRGSTGLLYAEHLAAREPMSTNEPPQPRRAHTRREVCVVLAVHEQAHDLQACLDSLARHTEASVSVIRVGPSAAAVNRALEQLAPADVVVLDEPCGLTPGWLERLRDAALADTNTATVSALSDRGSELALAPPHGDTDDSLAAELPANTLALHPRLTRAAGPCVYVRREALELVGPLDEELDLAAALELDFAQRCLLRGLSHLAADDVLVQRLNPAPRPREDELPSSLLERYPYLAEPVALGDSAVLTRALEAARGARHRLAVTIDARALDGAVTGTQVHIFELIAALARTEALSLRVLVRAERIDEETLRLLRELPQTEILGFEELDANTPRSAVFHRPQQSFSPGDVALALELGERFVISQLDLIAYRNPGYFADAGAWQDYRRASRHGLSAAERVVVFSDHTRQELLADALVDNARIRVVPPGLDHRAATEPRRPAALHGTGEPAAGFLLCLGTDFLHKNRVFALRLLAALRAEHGWEGSLILAGTHIPRGSSLELERAFLREHPELSNSVLDIGPVSEQEKAWLVAHAGAVVYPSAYEGFGLVPFESALSGVPCIFAPQSSLAEVAPEGTAAIVPWDAQASAAAAYSLLVDPAARERHVQTLAGAARELTWAGAAERLVEIYREAAVARVRDAATLSRDLVEREARLSVEHKLEAAQLVREREHAQRMYDELNAEVGSGLSLIGPHGSLPENLQRALLAIGARPALSGPLYGALARLFVLARALGRVLGGSRRAR
jgi:glycosyltransferase involved in cell wall biosynthesis